MPHLVNFDAMLNEDYKFEAVITETELNYAYYMSLRVTIGRQYEIIKLLSKSTGSCFIF